MNIIGRNTQPFILAVLFAAAQAAQADVIAPVGLTIRTVDVDQDGNLHSISWSGTLNAMVSDGPNGYLGGAFDTVRGNARDTSNKWYVQRTINGGALATVPLYGLPSNGNGLAANNVVALIYTPGGDYFTAYALTAGFYGGTGNGVNGPVYALALSSVGDLYVGGSFSKAGGFPYSTGIGVYGYQYGWNKNYIFSVFNSVHEFAWVNENQLKVTGFPGNSLTQVNFLGNGLHVTNNTAYWNTYQGQFGIRSYWCTTAAAPSHSQIRHFEDVSAPPSRPISAGAAIP